MTTRNNKRKGTTMKRFLKQLSLALLTCTLTLGTAASAHATSFFDYVGTSPDDHTIMGFVELSIAVPVPGITDVALSDVVDSGFSVSGPTYNFTLSHVHLFSMKALISPPENFSCIPPERFDFNHCLWFDGSILLVLFNGIFIAGDDVNPPSFGMGSWTFRTTGNNPVPEPSAMILLGTGFAGIIAWRRKQAA